MVRIKYLVIFLLFANCNTNSNNNNNIATKSSIVLQEEKVVDTITKNRNVTATDDTVSIKDEAKEMLFSFYTEYISKIDTVSINFPFTEKKIKQKYLTNNLIRKIEEDKQLEVDPLIGAQDSSIDELERMTIIKIKENIYNVCFSSTLYENENRCIELIVKRQGNQYKIADIKY